MSRSMRSVPSVCVGVGMLVCGATLMAGCATLTGVETGGGSGFFGLSLPVIGEDGKPRTLAELREAHAAKPRDADTTVAYARALKSSGKSKEALSIVEAASQAAPDNQKLVVEQGLMALELGQSAKAQHALMRASPDTNDWRILSGIGVAHAGLGQHANAQKYLEKALVLSPDNPTILNNLALSYILDKKVDKGRELLQRAAKAGGDKPQIARNLEMAMALKGGSKPRPPVAALPPTAPDKAPDAARATPAAKSPAEFKPIEKKPDPSKPVTPATPAEAADPPATAAAPEAKPEPKPEPRKTAAIDKATHEPITPRMLNLGGPLAGR